MTGPTPWWLDDPELVEIRRRTAQEFGIDLDAPVSEAPIEYDEDAPQDIDEPSEPMEPDPVTTELGNGRCRRELAEARDELIAARGRYDAAVLAARTAGYSWGEIGRMLGVAKQQLHRRFQARQRGRP